MKIFQITQLNESPQKAARLADKILSKWNTIKPESGQEQPTDPATPSTRGGARGGNARSMMDDTAAKIRSGEAQLNKDIDAELGKRGADPQTVHIVIMGKVQDAVQNLVSQISEQGNLSAQRLRMLRSFADGKLTGAAFGYINKKYLNGNDGSDGNWNYQTLDIVTRALQSQAPRGGSQPVGRVSSSRPNGQQGTVPSGGGTNALDAIAARNNPDF